MAELPELSVSEPTAMHALLDAQDTLISVLLTPLAGFGVDCVVQVVPFQRSARVRKSPPLAKSPTAVQSFTALQDTPLRLLMPGLGTVSSVQKLPFQPST